MARRIRSKPFQFKHGHARTDAKSQSPEYETWSGMIKRCENPRFKSFHLYGGRGIKVCRRWRMSFENFLADMGIRPSQKHSLDRIDVNGNYCPENCRWATATEQLRNMRGNVVLRLDGTNRSLAAWCELYGANYHLTWSRLNAGWELREALTRPRAHDPDMTANGTTMRLSQWAKKAGVTAGAILRRIKRGMPEEQALTMKRQKPRRGVSLCQL